MANHYLNFSEVLPRLSEEETHWLQEQLQVVHMFGDAEYTEDNLPEGQSAANADWIGCRAYRDLPGCEPDDAENVGFEYAFCGDDQDEDWGRHLWLFAEEWGDVERVAHLVQKFLKRFRPDQCWSLTWATTCSKPRVGEFGGGALFVTASAVKWQNTHEFVEQQEAAFASSGIATDRTAENDPTGQPSYHVAIDGPTFRTQRALLLRLQGLLSEGEPYQPTPGDGEVLEGLINLTDAIADQAHDRHGVDCLLDPDDDECDCQQPGFYCSGVPGILAHLENGRLAVGAEVERCDQCRRYPSDAAALERLRELGIA